MRSKRSMLPGDHNQGKFLTNVMFQTLTIFKTCPLGVVVVEMKGQGVIMALPRYCKGFDGGRVFMDTIWTCPG